MDDSRSSSFAGQGVYEIVAKSHLDKQWSPLFEGLTITTDFLKDGTPITRFAGPIVDQAALHGVLGKIRDTNMRLISVNQVQHSPVAEEERDLGDSQERDGENHMTQRSSPVQETWLLSPFPTASCSLFLGTQNTHHGPTRGPRFI
jgi:hypothetical protein